MIRVKIGLSYGQANPSKGKCKKCFAEEEDREDGGEEVEGIHMLWWI
jgi:hypothetical protein